MIAPSVRLLQGDALEILRTLPSESVHLVCTSPPYYGLRDYKTGTWEGGDPACDHEIQHQGKTGQRANRSFTAPLLFKEVCGLCGAIRRDQQLGLEPTLDAFLARLVAVFDEVRRVLHPSGVAFVDMGDSYANDGKWGGETGGKQDYLDDSDRKRVGREKRITALKSKDRCLIPFRLALALQASGWWVRDVICWHKPAPMPESVTDRCTQSWEPIFMLTKASRYFFDAEAIKEPSETNDPRRPYTSQGAWQLDGRPEEQHHGGERRNGESFNTRNPRNVWTIGPEPFTDTINGVSHFAAFPSELPKRCILAGSSARGVCPKCGEPWRRVVETNNPSKAANIGEDMTGGAAVTGNPQTSIGLHRNGGGVYSSARTTGWTVGCRCSAGDPVPATVLDPFAGTFTTGAVALELGRNAIGIELSEAYCELARRRLSRITPGLPLLA